MLTKDVLHGKSQESIFCLLNKMKIKHNLANALYLAILETQMEKFVM